MPRRPYQLQQRAWDPLNARYASLDYPEWVTMDRLPMNFWNDPHNHKRFIEWLGIHLGYKTPEDWYAVTLRDFLDHRGDGFLAHYGGSYSRALEVHFPEYDWKPWLFRQAPGGYWRSIENCAKFARWFENQLGFASLDDWYRITQNDVYKLHGMGLMDHFECSVQRFVHAVYPDYDWKPWLFEQVPKNFWPKRENRVAYMRWLGTKLGYKTPHDWYRLTQHDLVANEGASLIQYGYSTIDLIRELYPEETFYPWMFRQVSQGFFQIKQERIKYLQWLGNKLNFKTESDWLTLKRKNFAEHGGVPLFDQYYQGDMSKALQELFPDREWFPWEFEKTPVGYWDDAKNCREFLGWLGNRLGYESESDWYQVRRSDFRNNHGNGFIKRFSMPYLGLKVAFPEYDWLPWMFENVPVGFWYVRSNRWWYLSWLARQLDLNDISQWDTLSSEQLRKYRGCGLIAKMSVKEIRAEGAAWATSQ